MQKFPLIIYFFAKLLPVLRFLRIAVQKLQILDILDNRTLLLPMCIHAHILQPLMHIIKLQQIYIAYSLSNKSCHSLTEICHIFNASRKKCVPRFLAHSHDTPLGQTMIPRLHNIWLLVKTCYPTASASLVFSSCKKFGPYFLTQCPVSQIEMNVWLF